MKVTVELDIRKMDGQAEEDDTVFDNLIAELEGFAFDVGESVYELYDMRRKV